MSLKNFENKEFSVALASSSPQRKQILKELGIRFHSVETGITERSSADAVETVISNAKLKVLDAATRCGQEEVILGSDTILCANGKVRGKPDSPEEAVRYLTDLSGGTATAWTGVAAFLPDSGRGLLLVECAEILFRNFSPDTAAWYVGTGEPLTRAGALGISLLGEIFVEEIRGAHSCVAGLPKRSTLLACSDEEALGHHRMDLPQSVRNMLNWAWVKDIRRFAGSGQWL